MSMPKRVEFIIFSYIFFSVTIASYVVMHGGVNIHEHRKCGAIYIYIYIYTRLCTAFTPVLSEILDGIP